jgi:hypothetical protein
VQEADAAADGKSSVEVWNFFEVGEVERWWPSKRQYMWVTGWSRNGIEYPWLTRKEALSQCKLHGKKAKFIKENAQ